MVGGSSTLAIGVLGFDYSWTHPAPQAMHDLGGRFVCRYLSYDRTKNISAPERDRLWSTVPNPIGILLNWEQRAGAHLEGAATGAQHGAEAARLAAALGYPTHLPIVFSCDVGITVAQAQDEVAAYQDAAERACRPWPGGVYGGVICQDELHDRGLGLACHWQSYGWSTLTARNETQLPALVAQLYPGHPWEVDPRDASNRRAIVYSPHTHVFQRLGHTVDTDPIGGPGATDENVTRQRIIVWTPTDGPGVPVPPPVTPPFPPSEDTDMSQVWTIGGTLFLVTGRSALWLPGRNQDEVAVADMMVACYGAPKDLDQRALRVVYLEPGTEVPSYPTDWPGFRVTPEMFGQPPTQPSTGGVSAAEVRQIVGDELDKALPDITQAAQTGGRQALDGATATRVEQFQFAAPLPPPARPV